jgi:HEAT repeat protein
MIEQNSPVERIKAVNMMNQMEKADEKIIQSLLSTLENDENDNVRLIALDALARYADQPAVREGLINAIARQTSPMVQLRLAEIMVSLQEKRSVPEFQKILNNASLNYSVRNKLDETVKILI